MKYESDSNTNCNWCALYHHQRIDTGTRGLGNKRMSGDNTKDRIIKIGQNTEKGPEDMRKLAISQTPLRNHQLMLM